MKKKSLLIFACCFLLSGIAPAFAQEQKEQIVIPGGSQASSYAPEKNFTGRVRVDPAFKTESPQRTYGSYVTFEPSARTDWHIHPMGQVLIVMFGTGMTQEWGKEIQIIKQGDIVICPPNVKHWHGAAPNAAMTMAKLWAETVNKYGGNAAVVSLPDLGLHGNTHFPFSDLNNIQVADILSNWLKENSLNK